jgi:hypothetical protein
LSKISRNDPCPCGSGKKYKKCCLSKNEAVNFELARVRNSWESLNNKLSRFFNSDEWGDEFDLALMEYYHLEKEKEELPEIAEPINFFNWFVLDFFLEEDSRPIEIFIKEKFKSLPSLEQQIVSLLNDSYISLYEVIEALPDKGAHLKDIFSEEQVFVHDKASSNSLKKGIIISARVIKLDNNSYFSDIGPSFKPGNVIEIKDRVQKEIEEYWSEGFNNDSLNVFLKAEGGAFFTGFYLALQDRLMQMFKRMNTTEGDEMVFITAFYDVLDFEKTCNVLKTMPEMELEKETSKKLESIWVVEKKEGFLENIIYGKIVLTPRKLTLECRSNERIKLGKKLLAKHFKGIIKHKIDKIQSYEQMMKEAAKKHVKKPKNEIPQEIQNQLISQHLENHYKKWPDIKIPALDGKSPREAAKDPNLKEKLIWLLKDMEFLEEKRKSESGYGYDVNKIKKELSLDF